LAVALSPSISAQGYPEPIGNLIVTANCSEGGGLATIYATVQDVNGNGVSGAAVTFTLSTRASGDTGFYSTSSRSEAVQSVTSQTDSSGVAAALLQMGSTPGTYTVRAVSGGKAGQVSCYISAAKVEQPGIILPNTGTGHESISRMIPLPLVATAGAGLLGIIGVVIVLRRVRAVRA
jgi:hypothetical protein